MEIKIKDQDKLLDATIEMIDGVMVVSPKIKFEPKNGDVVASLDGNWIFICKGEYDGMLGTVHVTMDLSMDKVSFSSALEWCYSRYATEKEKQLLFDKLGKEGYRWDAEKLELVKIKWQPKVGDKFFFPCFEDLEFGVNFHTHECEKNIREDLDIQNGWCFKTEAECQEFCDRLNKAIADVKV